MTAKVEPRCPECNIQFDHTWERGDIAVVCPNLHRFPIEKVSDFAQFFLTPPEPSPAEKYEAYRQDNWDHNLPEWDKLPPEEKAKWSPPDPPLKQRLKLIKDLFVNEDNRIGFGIEGSNGLLELEELIKEIPNP
jgi:hypothetical protein